MIVTVHLHHLLQPETADDFEQRLDVTMLSGSSLADLMGDLGVGIPVEGVRLLVNGRIAELTQTLQEHDAVHLVPTFSGGSDFSL